MKPRAQGDHVYVATAGNFQKIGITSRPKKRFSELGSLGGRRASLVRIWYRPQHAAEIEREVKRKLRSLRHYGLEWFRIPLEEFLIYVQSLVDWFDEGTPIIAPKIERKVIVKKRRK